MKTNWRQVIINSQVDGTAVTAAAATTLLPAAAKETLVANFFDTVGQMLHIKATGRISSVITSPGTMTFDVRLGGTVVFNGLAILLDTVAAHTNVGWRLDIWMTLRVIGAAANFMGYGEWVCEDILGVPATAPKGVLTAVLPWNTPPVVGSNFDATAAQQLDLFCTPTVATGSIQSHQFYAESMN